MSDTNFSTPSHTNGPSVKIYDLTGTATYPTGPYAPGVVLVAWDPIGLQFLKVTVNSSGQLITSGGTQNVVPIAATSGGATPFKLVSAASTNATVVKTSTGQVYSVCAMNLNASPRYLKLYNKGSSPSIGTDTPVHTYMIPGNTSGGGFTLSIPVGMAFSTGIALGLTTGIADSDTGAVAANEIVVNLDYS